MLYTNYGLSNLADLSQKRMVLSHPKSTLSATLKASQTLILWVFPNTLYESQQGAPWPLHLPWATWDSILECNGNHVI